MQIKFMLLLKFIQVDWKQFKSYADMLSKLEVILHSNYFVQVF